MSKKLIQSILIVFCLSLLVMVGCGIFIANKAGVKLYTLSSSAMQPAMNAGDLAVGKTINPRLLHAGDVITYQSANGANADTKRIESINDKTGVIKVLSDNQLNSYETVNADDVLAKNFKTVPYLGYGLAELRHPEVLISLIYIPIVWIVLREGRRLARQYWRKPYSVN
jgi:signal peptidase I